jgi:hypothetical protein
MDATPISFDSALPLDSAFPAASPAGADELAVKWATLHDAAALVAALAGARADSPPDLPAAIRRAPAFRREIAAQGVDDLVAIMEPGLTALIAVHAAGGDPGAPARALWQEFTAARGALAALVLPHG